MAVAATFVSFGFAGTQLIAQEDGSWGHLTGRILASGKAPTADDLTITTDDRQYCQDAGKEFKDRTLVVGEDGGLKDVYVMMYFGRRDRKRPDVHPSYSDPKPVVIDNVNCKFEPRAIFVRTGQELELKNSDRIGHNCHIVTSGPEENVILTAGQSTNVELDEAVRVPGIVKCDIHDWMEATVLIRDEPYVAITDENGNFSIENIPEGDWTFQFWHKRVGFLATLELSDGNALGKGGKHEVTITAGDTMELGDMTVPVADLAKQE